MCKSSATQAKKANLRSLYIVKQWPTLRLMRAPRLRAVFTKPQTENSECSFLIGFALRDTGCSGTEHSFYKKLAEPGIVLHSAMA